MAYMPISIAKIYDERESYTGTVILLPSQALGFAQSRQQALDAIFRRLPRIIGQWER